jgi:predicted regulator of Ras-like GTPase activity (Roadblock/LC7/MglB family)
MMKKLLEGLNKNIGIRGSIIMTLDGVVVEACLGGGLDEETIAALASSILQGVTRPDPSFGIGKVSRFSLSAKHGRLIFEIMESLVLVVVTDKNIDLDITLLEIAGLAKRLQRMVKISV